MHHLGLYALTAILLFSPRRALIRLALGGALLLLLTYLLFSLHQGPDGSIHLTL